MPLGCGAKQQKRCWLSGKIAKFAFFTAGSQPTECAVQQGISDFLTADEKTYWKFSADSGCTYRVRIFRHIDFTKMNQFICNKFTTFTATTTSNRFDDTESIVHRCKP